jgi:hypothetical protein
MIAHFILDLIRIRVDRGPMMLLFCFGEWKGNFVIAGISMLKSLRGGVRF